MENLKYALDIVEMMIDRLTRELYSNGSMMGAVNSAYESMTQAEKDNYNIKRKQLNNLIKYKTDLLDAALNEMNTNGASGKKVTIETGFDFSL
jgi:hypothetical protein